MSESNKPKIVVILSRFPYPLEKGDKLRAYHQLIELSKTFQITLISISENTPEPNSIAEIKKICEECIIYVQPKWKSWMRSCIALFSGKPLQIAYFHSFQVQRKIEKQIKLIRPAHIYCQLIRVAEYVKNYHDCPKTLDYMDAFSAGMQRRITLAPFYLKWLFSIESKRLFDYERQIYDYFENHTIISEQDKLLLGVLPNQKVTCIPNGVSPLFFETDTQIEKEFDIVFVGNLNYPPNVEAVKFIVKEILPAAKKLGRELRFLAAGAHPSKSIVHLENKTQNFTLLPNPVDIRSAYWKGRIFVAPMKIGTGLQNKLLESMALGIPSITTELANNALNAIDNESILIASSANDFVEKIILLDNQELYSKIAQNGKEFIRKNFDWENTSKPLIEAIKKI